MTDSKTKELTVDSIHQGAFLIAKGIPVLRVMKSGRQGLFIYASDKAAPLLQEYIAGRGLVEPRTYASAIRELKRAADEATSIYNGGGR
jgi:hypothetical protein